MLGRGRDWPDINWGGSYAYLRAEGTSNVLLGFGCAELILKNASVFFFKKKSQQDIVVKDLKDIHSY